MNNIRLTLEFDITQGKQGWNNFLNYGKEVKQQLNGLFVSPTKFMGMDQIGKEAVASGTGVDELIKKVQQLENQLEKVRTKSSGGAGLPQFKQLTGDSRMAVNAFNYTLQDSGMFFVNFRMGMMSISNNIPMLIQGLLGMKREAAEGNKSFKTYLKESFSGPNAFLPVISLVSVAMIALPAIFDKLSESARQAAEEGIRTLTKELESLSNFQIVQKLNSISEAMVNLANKTLKVQAQFGAIGAIYNLATGKNATIEGLAKQLQLLTDEKGKREELNKTILGRLDLEKKEIEYKKTKLKIDNDSLSDEAELLILNNKLADVNERIRKVNMSSTDLEKEKSGYLDKQLKTLKEIYAIKKSGEPDTSGRDARANYEQELQDLEVANIKDSETRQLRSEIIKYNRTLQRINKEVKDEQLKYLLLAELYAKYLKDLQRIREEGAAEKKESEAAEMSAGEKEYSNFIKNINLTRSAFESLGDVLRGELISAWEDIFGEANSLAEKFGQRLLEILMDIALRAATLKLFENNFDIFKVLFGAITGFAAGGPGGAIVGAAGSALSQAGGSNRSSYNNSGSNYQTDMLNYAMLPNQAEVRTVLIQPDMSGVRDEIRSWAKEVDLKWDYNQFKAGLTAHEHRQSFEE